MSAFDLPRFPLDIGQYVFRFGATDGRDALFLVDQGELSLWIGADDGGRPLTLRRGDVFGGAVGLGPARVAVRAVTPSTVVRLEAPVAEALLSAADADPERHALFVEIRRSLLDTLSRQLSAAAALAPAPAAATPRLVAGEAEFPLDRPPGLLVGRASSSGSVDVDLGALPAGPTVSRRHLWIRAAAGRLAAEPAGESEVYVNGELLRAGRPRPLDDRDVLRLGEAELIFRIG